MFAFVLSESSKERQVMRSLLFSFVFFFSGAGFQNNLHEVVVVFSFIVPLLISLHPFRCTPHNTILL